MMIMRMVGMRMINNLRYRDYFLDEVHPMTGELREEAALYRSPTHSDTFPMSDFLSSMHADIDCEGSLKRRTEPGPGTGHGKSLIKTRRLLYWSYQVSYYVRLQMIMTMCVRWPRA